MPNTIESITTLHEWREKYNGENIGYGYDYYAQNEQLHYPEAYATWGKGYLNLQEYGYRELAVRCAEWLKENRSPIYRNDSWGLPFKWKDTPAETSYVITTIQVAEFFQKLGTLRPAHSAAKWIIEENGYEETPEGIWFHYTPDPTFQIPVYNITAKAAGFLNRLGYEELAKEAVRYIVNHQNPDGSWYYSTENKATDNLHMGITIEGLCEAEAPKEAIQKAIEFYWNNLYRKSGYAREEIKIHLFPLTKGSILHKIHGRLIPREAKIEGYAAGIKAFLKAGCLEYAATIARHAITLQKEDGSFPWMPKEKTKSYIRSQAHIFEALTQMVRQ